MIISKKKNNLALKPNELRLISKKLVLRKDVSSLFLYGSQLTGKRNSESDIDLLIVIKKLNSGLIKDLIKNKQELEFLLKRKISLNIHTLDELNPLYQKLEIFLHKNRSELIIYKYKYHYKLIYGNNVFEDFRDPDLTSVKKEAIKMLLSFSYFLKKFTLNPDLAPHKEKEFIRMPLISLEYIAAFYGYVALDKYDAFAFLKARKILSRNQLSFVNSLFNKKIENNLDSILFLDKLRNKLVRELTR